MTAAAPSAAADAVWDLSPLYSSADSPAFSRDFEEAGELLTELETTLAAASVSAGFLEVFLPRLDKAFMLLADLSGYVTLSLLAGGSESAAAGRVQPTVQALCARQRGLLESVTRKVSESGLAPKLAECPELRPYAPLLHDCARLAEHALPAGLAPAIRQMQLTGGYAWQRLRDTLDAAAAVTVPFPDGTAQTLPLAEARALASHPDRAVRRAAYSAELAAYPGYSAPMAAAFSAIKGEALSELPYKGFDSELDEMLFINKMDRQTLDSMMASIKVHLPVLRDFLLCKAQLLGLSGPLAWYDLTAPLPNGGVCYSFAQARASLVDAFTAFHPDMGRFIARAFDEHWIDALPREGKQGGALCADLPGLRQNRVFANFTGSVNGLRTLAHELGHGLHFRCLDELPMILRDPPTPLCETASIFNELIMQEHLTRTAPPEGRLALLDAALSETVQTVVDIYSRFLFEDEAFRRRAAGGLSDTDLCDLMAEAQKEAYGHALDPHSLHPYMWMCKVHYYIPEFHYYNFPYTFGLLFARGLYAGYQNHPDGFFDRYCALLRSTCEGDAVSVGQKAGFDIRSRAFWDDAFAGIAADVREYLSLAGRSL